MRLQTEIASRNSRIMSEDAAHPRLSMDIHQEGHSTHYKSTKTVFLIGTVLQIGKEMLEEDNVTVVRINYTEKYLHGETTMLKLTVECIMCGERIRVSRSGLTVETRKGKKIAFLMEN